MTIITQTTKRLYEHSQPCSFLSRPGCLSQSLQRPTVIIAVPHLHKWRIVVSLPEEAVLGQAAGAAQTSEGRLGVHQVPEGGADATSDGLVQVARGPGRQQVGITRQVSGLHGRRQHPVLRTRAHQEGT